MPLQDLQLVGEAESKAGVVEGGRKSPKRRSYVRIPRLGGGGGESKGSARSRGARDAYCQECAGGAGSTQLAVARPPLPAACVLSANLQIRIPPPS